MKFTLSYSSKKTQTELSKHTPSFEIDSGGGGVDVAKDDADGFYGDDKSENPMSFMERGNSGGSSRLLKTRAYSKSHYSLSLDQAGSSPSQSFSSYKNRFSSESNIEMLGVQQAGNVRRRVSPNPSPRLSSRQTSHDDEFDGYVRIFITVYA